MELLREILNTVNTVPPNAWEILIEIIVSALTVSPIMVGVKRWLNISDPKRREKIMTFAVLISSMLATVGFYLKDIPEFAPWFIAVQGLLVFATTQPVYFYLVKPLFRRLGASLAIQLNKAKSLNEAKTATVPPEGLPIPSNPTVLDDFSR